MSTEPRRWALDLPGHTGPGAAATDGVAVHRVVRLGRFRPPLAEPDEARVDQLKAGEEARDLGLGPGRARRGGVLPVHVELVGRLREQVVEGLGRGMRQDQVAAGRERVDELRHGGVRLLVVGYEMQHADQQHTDRLGEVQQALHRGMAENARRGAQVALHRGGQFVAGEDVQALGHRHGVDVDVDHPGVGRRLLGDLVDVAGGRDARADVEELADPEAHEVADGPTQERPIGARHRGDAGKLMDEGACGRMVGREVVDAAEVVVVDPCSGRRLLRGVVRRLIHAVPPLARRLAPRVSSGYRKSSMGTASLRINSKIRRYSSTSAGSSKYSAPTCDSRYTTSGSSGSSKSKIRNAPAIAGCAPTDHGNTRISTCSYRAHARRCSTCPANTASPPTGRVTTPCPNTVTNRGAGRRPNNVCCRCNRNFTCRSAASTSGGCSAANTARAYPSV